MKKRLVFLFLMATMSVVAFSQNYYSFIGKATEYESQNKYCNALIAWTKAVACKDLSPAEKQFAAAKYLYVSNQVREASIETSGKKAKHDLWKTILADTESFWKNYFPYDVLVTTPELKPDTADVYVSNISINRSKVYTEILKTISDGYKRAYSSEWTDLPLPEEWTLLINSFYKAEVCYVDLEGNEVSAPVEVVLMKDSVLQVPVEISLSGNSDKAAVEETVEEVTAEGEVAESDVAEEVAVEESSEVETPAEEVAVQPVTVEKKKLALKVIKIVLADEISNSTEAKAQEMDFSSVLADGGVTVPKDFFAETIGLYLQYENERDENEAKGYGRITNKEADEQRSANERKGFGFIMDIDVIAQRDKNEQKGYGAFTNAECDTQRAVNKAKGFGEITDAECVVEREKNLKKGYGEITNFEAVTQKAANAEKGLGEITDLEVVTQRDVNKQNGKGEITDAECLAQRDENKKNGLGDYTDAECDTQKGENSKNGFGFFTNQQCDTQRLANSSTGAGFFTDTECAKQRTENNGKGYGNFTDVECENQRKVNDLAGFGKVTDTEREAQKAANEENGRGSVSDQQVATEKAKNEALGFGAYTDSECNAQREANKDAGRGFITDEQVIAQRTVNADRGYGSITDAEAETERMCNEAKKRGTVTDLQYADLRVEKSLKKNTFSSAFLLFPQKVSYYYYGDYMAADLSLFNMTLGLGKWVYAGTDIRMGYVFGENQKTTDALAGKLTGSAFELCKTTVSAVGIIGFDWNITKNIRTSLFGEAGIINNALGVEGGAQFEVHFTTPVKYYGIGLVMSGAYGWTPSDYLLGESKSFAVAELGLQVTF